jgi:hypothetical protein
MQMRPLSSWSATCDKRTASADTHSLFPPRLHA